MGWQLFMRFVEAVFQIQPRFFLYENVASMPNNIKDYISDELGCEPILINSALVSAQQRKRLYWTNIRGIMQPTDKGILLKDIIESGLPYTDKSHCITATYQGAEFRSSIEKKKRTMVAEPLALSDKSQTILSSLYKENALSMVKRQKTGLFVAQEVSADEMGAALRTRADDNGSFKRLEVRDDGKLNALTTVLTDSVVCSPVRIGTIGKGGQGDRIYSVHGKTVCISANGGGRGAKTGLYKINLPDGDYTVRKLTPIEAERCQTLPDNYTAYGVDDIGKAVNISNTQRYKAIGNGWTVDVISHIFSHMDGGDV
jgi:DNA (cytosine-5)-methyltransferase 3A